MKIRVWAEVEVPEPLRAQVREDAANGVRRDGGAFGEMIKLARWKADYHGIVELIDTEGWAQEERAEAPLAKVLTLVPRQGEG